MTGDSIQPNLRACQNHGLAPVLRRPVVTLASGVAGSRCISRVPGNLFLCCLHSLPGSPKVELWPQKLQTSVILTASIPCRRCVCVCVCVCVCAVPQSCWAHCSPVDCSLPGSSVCGIFPERILERVAIPSSRGSPRPRDRIRDSCITGGFFTY